MRALRFCIVGGGPAGNSCASVAARLGADVTLIEKDIVGGAANLWDCIPSKAMIAAGGVMSFVSRATGMGLDPVTPTMDLDGLRDYIESTQRQLHESLSQMLESQGVRILEGTGSLAGPHEVVAHTSEGRREITADVIVLSTGSRPRVPEWCTPDGQRVLTTRQAYPPPEVPQHLVIIGSGVTGVEFVHMFKSFGSDVTLIVSRQQVLPGKDPEVAALLEESFLARKVSLYKGARASAVDVDDDGVAVRCNDGRVARGTHALLAVGAIPNSEDLGLAAAGVESTDGYVTIDHNCRSSAPHIYAAGDLSGKALLSSVAAMQGRKIAEHAMGLHKNRPHRHIDYSQAASAVFTEPEIAEVGLTEAEATGRKIRVTKMPFSVTPKALINNDPRGFLKLVSDPATGVVLGGSIVGGQAAELISVVALAVTARLTVNDISETLFAHPTLSEALGDAAE
ncbi:MAG: SidA/IucD/PvdA family monooxygenase [Acidimicrobiia bacterium]|nr:SidA/IucD/PvdA family monooxygenase [Acidimicrobiia bacterium]